MRRRIVRTALVCVAALVATTWLAFPAGAVTRWITEQGAPGRPFTFEALPAALEILDTEDAGEDLRLADVVLGRIDRTSPIYGGQYPDPRSIEVLDNGNLLFADRSGGRVAEATPAGEPVWQYSRAEDASIGRPFSAQRFTHDGREYTLVADRDTYRVWAVDADHNTVWQYGVSGEQGLGPNHLMDPFYARYSPEDGGTVLIADNLGGCRVIEVRYSDYQAGAPDNGFTAGSVTWSYGEPGVSGNGPGQLCKPHSAQRLASGNVLICDAGDDLLSARVIEVDRASGAIAWQYGVTGPPGTGDGYLQEANFASRLPDGDTLITDTLAGRVLRVTPAEALERVWDQNEIARPEGFGSGSSSPRAAAFMDDGRLVVADSVFQQIAIEGHENSATATSTALDCGHPGVDKAFVSLTWKGDTGEAGTSVRIEYRVGADASWRPCAFTGGSRRYDFKAGTHGVTIAYRVTLQTDNAARTPVVDEIIIQSMKATTAGNGGGGGGGGDKPGGSGNSGQSGVYTYPSTAEGGTGTSGTGIGSGSSGAGSGSGSSGAGAGGSGAGSGTSSAATSVDVPVQSTGSDSAVPVEGYQVQGEEGVSGVPLKAVEGAQAPEPERPGPPVPVRALIVAGLIVAAAFFVPWPFVAAQMRRITGFDHTRRRSLPFRPLGK